MIGLAMPANAGEVPFPDPKNMEDLGSAVVIAPRGLSKREQKAVQVLIEEIEKRTTIRWTVSEGAQPQSSGPRILVGSQRSFKGTDADLLRELKLGSDWPSEAEGFLLRTVRHPSGSVIAILGADERGVLFGVGEFLRKIRMAKGKVYAPLTLEITSAPKYRLRGHQMGYRPKTNAYDAWTVPIWDQYIRELAIFGTNAIEIIPPRSDDAADGPHFPLPPMRMMAEMSRMADDYGLDVWVWYPAMDPDYSDPRTVESALRESAEVFKAVPRIDAVFVPGGDPGRTQPKYMLAFMEKQAENLRRFHPRAQMWMSPQSFDETWLQEFLEIINREQLRWLDGIVYGPQNRLGLSALRKKVPARYPIRLYPDITHSTDCQFPVADWDVAYVISEGREVINPRPRAQADIFRVQAPHSIGFISYSEGCNDDVNKFLWSALAWNPDKPIVDILREYSALFVSDRLSEGFAQGSISLEANWRGPLIANASVYTTLEQFQTMETTATPAELLSWRFQMGLYRAYYDAYVRSRLIQETNAQDRAISRLAEIRRVGAKPIPLDVDDEEMRATNGTDPLELIRLAEIELDAPLRNRASQDWRARILALGEALYQSIRMQLAVEGYQAEAVTRAANLDTLDTPLTDGPWLRKKFAEIRKLPSASEQIGAIEAILGRTNPGPGGFYDNLGDVMCQSHLVRGVGASQDPEFRATSFVGGAYPDFSGTAIPVAWKRWAGALFDAPLQMFYPELESWAQYRVRVVYGGDAPDVKIRLAAGDNIEIHPLIDKPVPIRPLEFDIPQQATAKGCLTLSWYRPQGLGGNGRGCQVSEVWLMKK
jgi:hypothetical protein